MAEYLAYDPLYDRMVEIARKAEMSVGQAAEKKK